MKVLNLLVTGKSGGIESLCQSISVIDSNIDNRWLFIFSGGNVADDMKKSLGDNVIILNEKKNFIKIVKVISDYCKKNHIDVVTIHHGGMYTNLIYITLRYVNKNIKFVRYLHSCLKVEKFNLKRIINNLFLQKSLNVSDLIICVSETVKLSHISNLKISNKNIVVVYNGINSQYFDITNKLSEENNLIFAGRLEEYKGVKILLLALAKLIDDFKDIKLYIVGDGSEKQNLIELSKELKIDSNVIFTGRKLNVLEWLQKSKIFIYPVICDEAFGISIVEAMSQGLIVVASNKGGIPEIINDGANGFLVDDISPDRLADKIKYILSIPNHEIERLSNQAIMSSQNYKIEKVVSRLEEEYKKL